MKITLIAAISSDGFIANNAGVTIKTSQSDKKLLKQLLDSHTTHLYGRKTFEAVLPILRWADTPKRYVLTRDHSTITPVANNAVFVSTLDELFSSKNKTQSSLVLGGTALYDFAIEHALATKIYLTVTPQTLRQGVPFLTRPNMLLRHYTLSSTKRHKNGEEYRIYTKK